MILGRGRRAIATVVAAAELQQPGERSWYMSRRYLPVIGRASWLTSMSELRKLKLTSEHVVTGVFRLSSVISVGVRAAPAMLADSWDSGGL